MITANYTIFGRDYTQPNTFIGGVSATINTASALATKLGISVSRISVFRIDGANIEANVSGTYPMPSSAFSANTSITYFRDEENRCTSLGSFAFYQCTNLELVKFEAVTSVNEAAFISTKLVNLNLPALLSAGNQPFQLNGELLTFSAPLWATFTGTNNAFTNCAKMTTCTTPLLPRLSNNHFSGCVALTSVNLPNVTTFSGSNNFYNCTALVTAYLPQLTTVGVNMFYNNTSLVNLTLSNSLTSVGNTAFYFCTSLPSTAINWTNITTIGVSSFRSCTSFTSITMSSILNVQAEAFWFCTGLTYFSAPLATTITYRAFNGCTALATVNFPEVTLVDSSSIAITFGNCNSLHTVSLPKATEIRASAFQGLTGLNTFSAPLVVTLGNTVFSGCSGMTSCNIPSVVTIGASCFTNCTGLPSFATNHFDNVTAVGYNAFLNCSNTNFKVLKFLNLVTPPQALFQDCIYLETVDLPAATSLPLQSLWNCYRLTTLNIPEVTNIGNDQLQNFSGTLYNNLTTFNAPKCTVLGTTTNGSNNVFNRAKVGIVINVNVALQTADAGSPDGDLVWAIANKSATVNYIS